jgi:hypothetical protein
MITPGDPEGPSAIAASLSSTRVEKLPSDLVDDVAPASASARSLGHRLLSRATFPVVKTIPRGLHHVDRGATQLGTANHRWFQARTRDPTNEGGRSSSLQSTGVAPQNSDHCFFVYGAWKCSREDCARHVGKPYSTSSVEPILSPFASREGAPIS